MSTDHPYRHLPDQAFWSRAVAHGFEPRALVANLPILIGRGERVVSAGSCFAQHVAGWIEATSARYVRDEATHPAFASCEEAAGYRLFSAAYGNIYTVRHLRQLLARALGDFSPAEDRWLTPSAVIDPFRPGLRFPAATKEEFDALTAAHLCAVRRAFSSADVFVFTLGLTEAWASRTDGAVFPACPGTVAGEYDPDRHLFVNFTVTDVIDDLTAAFALARRLSPDIRFVLTVSPVPLVATAASGHVVQATAYSKAVLRAAAGAVATEDAGVIYFPSYEIICGPQAPDAYFEADRRTVSEHGLAAVRAVFLSRCEGAAPAAVSTIAPRPLSPQAASAMIVAEECEELAAEKP